MEFNKSYLPAIVLYSQIEKLFSLSELPKILVLNKEWYEIYKTLLNTKIKIILFEKYGFQSIEINSFYLLKLIYKSSKSDDIEKGLLKKKFIEFSDEPDSNIKKSVIINTSKNLIHLINILHKQGNSRIYVFMIYIKYFMNISGSFTSIRKNEINIFFMKRHCNTVKKLLKKNKIQNKESANIIKNTVNNFLKKI